MYIFCFNLKCSLIFKYAYIYVQYAVMVVNNTYLVYTNRYVCVYIEVRIYSLGD